LLAKKVSVFVDEETSKDKETKHRKEKVAWLVLWGNEGTTNMIDIYGLKDAPVKPENPKKPEPKKSVETKITVVEEYPHPTPEHVEAKSEPKKEHKVKPAKKEPKKEPKKESDCRCSGSTPC